ncbi:family 2 encapsulin nanocompartment cargo protein polyprenyl transferase [Acrocarpospora catenulata]|uniref:family 2 encapsulin nanocompartment cargo protein polyprenyl transferase n=1 Tax=Acrocarpospora catenulata TaxID=2836182 RepID=UPI001BDB6200|nr:family 2 encapsulin nanocompartment cargo protein polyprenyl transferase [Acrocarpospora catenulata]
MTPTGTPTDQLSGQPTGQEPDQSSTQHAEHHHHPDPLCSDHRSARELLDWSRALLRPALGQAVDKLPSSMRHINGYHLGWWDAHGTPAEADSGKAIRPTLTLLAAQAAGGDVNAAVPAAVSVELAHNFSLLHDDVMDGDTTRRHRPTAWSVFGVSQAILAGDSALSLAFQVLAASGHPLAHEGVSILNTAVQHLLQGQSSDIAFEERPDVNLTECLAMATGKTAALISCACTLGALFGGATPTQLTHLRAFGDHLGLAFQLADDLLGIWGDPTITGKPIHSDLANRKKSLPVVAALTSGTPAARELSALYTRDDLLTDTDLTHAATLVTQAGGQSWTQTKATTLLNQALTHLTAANLPPAPTAELTTLATLMVHRDV